MSHPDVNLVSYNSHLSFEVHHDRNSGMVVMVTANSSVVGFEAGSIGKNSCQRL